MASRTVSVSKSRARSTWATWPSAWTPASVRPHAHLHALPAERLDRRHELALHSQAGFLHLPAHEWTTVIFDRELVARHGVNHTSG